MNESQMEGAQDFVDDALHRSKRTRLEYYAETGKKYILENLSDDDLSKIEKEHWPNIKRLHEERISEQKANRKEE